MHDKGWQTSDRSCNPILAHIPMNFKGSFPHMRTAGSDILSELASFIIWLLHVSSGELFSPYGTCETYLKPLVMFNPLPTWLGIPYTFLKSATAEQSLICTLMWEKKSSFYRTGFYKICLLLQLFQKQQWKKWHSPCCLKRTRVCPFYLQLSDGGISFSKSQTQHPEGKTVFFQKPAKLCLLQVMGGRMTSGLLFQTGKWRKSTILSLGLSIWGKRN